MYFVLKITFSISHWLNKNVYLKRLHHVQLLLFLLINTMTNYFRSTWDRNLLSISEWRTIFQYEYKHYTGIKTNVFPCWCLSSIENVRLMRQGEQTLGVFVESQLGQFLQPLRMTWLWVRCSLKILTRYSWLNLVYTVAAMFKLTLGNMEPDVALLQQLCNPFLYVPCASFYILSFHLTFDVLFKSLCIALLRCSDLI